MKPIHLHLLEGNANRLTKDEMEQLLKAEQRLQVERMIRCSCQENNLGELLELDIITNIDVNGSPQYKVKKLKR